MLSLHI